MSKYHVNFFKLLDKHRHTDRQTERGGGESRSFIGHSPERKLRDAIHEMRPIARQIRRVDRRQPRRCADPRLTAEKGGNRAAADSSRFPPAACGRERIVRARARRECPRAHGTSRLFAQGLSIAIESKPSSGLARFFERYRAGVNDRRARVIADIIGIIIVARAFRFRSQRDRSARAPLARSLAMLNKADRN